MGSMTGREREKHIISCNICKSKPNPQKKIEEGGRKKNSSEKKKQVQYSSRKWEGRGEKERRREREKRKKVELSFLLANSLT